MRKCFGPPTVGAYAPRRQTGKWQPNSQGALGMDGTGVTEYASPDGVFSFQLNEHPGYHLLRMTGVVRLADAQRVVATLAAVGEKLGGKYRLLVPLDFSEVPPESRRFLSDALLGDASPLSRISSFGGSFAVRTMFNLYGRVATMPMRFFANREDALAWLLSDERSER